MDTNAATIMTTVKDRAAAAAMAEFLIQEKVAACVQEIAVHSHYRWDGQTQSEPEVLLLIKTAADRVDDAIAAIRGKHSYQVPEIVVTPVVGGLGAYLQWVRDETRPAVK